MPTFVDFEVKLSVEIAKVKLELVQLSLMLLLQATLCDLRIMICDWLFDGVFTSALG